MEILEIRESWVSYTNQMLKALALRATQLAALRNERRWVEQICRSTEVSRRRLRHATLRRAFARTEGRARHRMRYRRRREKKG